MSLVLTGNASNVSSLSATVTALANNGAGAIRVTTSAPHLFGNGDTVVMNASPAFGPFTITVIDATHFDLQGSTFTATGTGTVADTSLTPQVQVPSDGDPFSAQLSGLLSAFQATLDRTQYLRHGLGAYKLASLQIFSLADDYHASLNWWTITVGALNSYTLGNKKIATVSNVSTLDTLEISFGCSLEFNSSPSYFEVGFAATNYAFGGSPGTPLRIGGSSQLVASSGSASGIAPATMSGWYIPTQAGNVDIWPMGAILSGSTGIINIPKESTMIVKVWRSTGMSQ